MLNSTPSISALDAASSFLQILEYAKDATAVRSAIATIRGELANLETAKDALKAERAALTTFDNDTKRRAAEVAAQKAAADSDLAKVTAGFSALESDKEAFKTARAEVDKYAFETREQLSAIAAKLASDTDATAKARAEVEAMRVTLVAEIAAAKRSASAADARRDDYQAKIDALRAQLSA